MCENFSDMPEYCI